MNKFDRLLDIARKENITVKYVDEIPELDSEALYVARHGIRMILLANFLKQNMVHMTEVLAEELGHYFTSVGNNVSPENYSDRVDIDKCETKAMKWACETLVPLDELVAALRTGIDNIADLADALSVSSDLLMKSLYFLSLNRSFIHIEGNRYMILSNYPTVYIYEDIK